MGGHVRFWERAEVKFLRATRHGPRSGQGALSVRITSSTGNFGSPSALTLRATCGLMHRSKHSPSFDHFVGGKKEGEGHVDPERTCCFPVDDQPERLRQLHWQITG